MNTLHLYNTLNKTLEPFTSIAPKHVGIYVCGPTVYGPPHLGHVRGPIVFDVLRRYLILQGYKVRFVRNITDVGHLVGDADEGEDKLAKQAKVEQLEPMEVAQTYTDAYNSVMDRINVMKPSIEPRATGHIIEQIEMIQTIIEKGLAYEVNGSVYFDVMAYSQQSHYGVLSGRVLEDLQAGAGNQSRSLEGQDEKRNPNDFALWKRASAEHIMQWSSPWGKGFPGWHIECSAMSARYLGEHFDIHGGGMDLLFPHHECEIAQSTAAHDRAPAKYWIHHNMITINGQKMAKSLGNGIMVEQLFKGEHPLLSQAFGPMTLRFFVLQAHYRGTLDFSNDALLAAQKGWQRMQSAFQLVSNLPTVNEGATLDVADVFSSIVSSLNDDLNTPQAIASFFELSRRINLVNDGKETITAETKTSMQQLIQDYCKGVLGLIPEDAGAGDGLSDAMDIILSLRGQAKADKNWALSDQIRDALKEKGFEIKDGKEGTTWNKL
ncbi:MAG: cysteine--tRNA ligase [Bacteroidetes bacterium]|nr:cysteine--tRNA ligase [Bacteroidota bacterium]